MSPILFNLVIENVIRNMTISSREGVQFQGSLFIGLLAYGDDLVIMEESQNGLKRL